MRQPNIIYIFADQLGANHLGCYGAHGVHTPTIDRLAARSLVFDKAYTATPICTPYRASLFSGHYPSTTGVTENGMRLPNGVGPTLADVLENAGYRTAYVGKWHLSGEPQENRWVPPDRRAGFRDFVGWESHHVDHWAGRIWRDDPASSEPSPEELPMPGHETDALTDIAIEKVEELASSAMPFCFFLAYQAPHPPCSPPPEFEALYTTELPRLPNLPERPPAYKKPEWNAEYPNDEFRRRYWGEVSHLDAALGRFLDAAEDLGLFDSSVLVFTSDHGEMAGARGRYGKWVMFEESVRVPLLVSVPGQQATGRRARDLISTVDFLPTFSEIAGVKPPADLPGVSFARRWQALAGAGDPAAGGASGAGPRRYAFMEYRDRAVTDGRYKLVLPGANPDVGSDSYSTGLSVLLFDLDGDPREQRNLAGTDALRDVEARLRRELAEW